MRPVLFVKADAAETFGVGPGAVVDAGAEIRVWDAIGGEPVPSLDEVAAIVLFGSTFNIEHADEQPFINTLRHLTTGAIEARVPFLGLCFGAQVLAWSLGTDIHKAPIREVGYVPVRPLAPVADDPLFSHLADGEPVFQWHMDTFDLPRGADLLVKGDDVANQAYRFGDAAWATQFHLEIDVPELELWIAAVADTVQDEWGKSPSELLAEAAAHHERHEDMGREVFRRFVKVAREHA
jgi:GMP synthase (glutamine-hydrolysing)